MKISASNPLHASLGCLLLAFGISLPVQAASSAEGVQLDLRYRIEQVDQGGFEHDALASTLRTRLGYRFADHNGWSGLISLQDNRSVGNDRYNSTRNGRSNYPVVADPQDTELDQAYVEYTRGQSLDFRLGRQIIKLDNDRFVGNVGFRQLQQSFDAARLQFAPTPGLTVDYAYLTRVNRIFGAHHPDALHARQNLDTHLLNVAWAPAAGKLVAYVYLIGNQSLPGASHRDVGLRWTASVRPQQPVHFEYTVEAARQHAWRDGTLSGSRDYLHAQARLVTHAWQWTIGHERLQGDGTSALQTPLATLHAFNGWADRFLSTPPDGLADSYLGIGWAAPWAKLTATAHRFAATHGSQHYGNEFDMAASKAFDKHLAGSLALADYHSDGFARDTRILWLTLGYHL